MFDIYLYTTKNVWFYLFIIESNWIIKNLIFFTFLSICLIQQIKDKFLIERKREYF